MQKDKVTIYIDGFNFYYGLRRIKKLNPTWKKYYWIDFVKLFEQFLGIDQELRKVIYFTASPLNPQKSSRQSALLNANKLINGSKFEIVRGKYFSKQILCPHCNGSISKPEEKRTDVNISVRMIGDCALNYTDVLILVSADSDLVPPIEFIQKEFKDKKIKVYFPPTAFCDDLQQNILIHKGKIIQLEKNAIKFENSIMPNEVSDEKSTYKKPDKWE